jgi:hypothetical protein
MCFSFLKNEEVEEENSKQVFTYVFSQADCVVLEYSACHGFN